MKPRCEQLRDLCDSMRVGPLVGQILYNRGITRPEEAYNFLHAGHKQLHRPELLPQLDRAAERIVRAASNGEKIAIYGDYDVDGVTSSALLYHCLKLAGARPTLYIPHRIEEGYGLNCDALRQLAEDGHTLIVTVDCGTTSLAEAELASSLGVDLIITDHHEPGEKLPPAYAIVNPKLPDSNYPFRELAGVGLAFKLAWAIGLKLAGGTTCATEFQEFLTDATSLAALGTIADVVPLVGENRVLATLGLRSLSNRRYHAGLQAIVESARLSGSKVGEHDVAFIIGPRLNAAGRMGHANQALRLLTDAGPQEAAEIAAELEQVNRQRQETERRTVEQAIEQIESQPDWQSRWSHVLWDQRWHVGVIGIVASRIVERYGRPVLMIALDDQRGGQGSGRSIAALNLFNALGDCSSQLLRYGGHAMAAGLRIERDRLEEFRESFEAAVKKRLRPADFVPSIEIDGQLQLATLTEAAVRELQLLAPFGQGNPQPLFAAANCRSVGTPRRIGAGGRHLAIQLTQAGTSLRGICWQAGEMAEKVARAERLDIAIRPKINTFNGRQSVEVEIVDIHIGGYRDPHATNQAPVAAEQ